ncbi:MAG: DUF4433 domain-containing protein [Candidatus Marinimicrobia bacterium]|nr:DUF4433 domain-containing protein [Candidatus Neomarinimicrobiota bacterium]
MPNFWISFGRLFLNHKEEENTTVSDKQKPVRQKQELGISQPKTPYKVATEQKTPRKSMNDDQNYYRGQPVVPPTVKHIKSPQSETLKFFQLVKTKEISEWNGNRISVITENEYLMNFNPKTGVVLYEEDGKPYVTVPTNQIDSIIGLIQKQKTTGEKHPIPEVVRRNYVLKEDAVRITNLFSNHGISKLYHFTDRSNISSINRHRGLRSWRSLAALGIKIPAPGGSDFSRKLDQQKHLEDYVRLSFHPDQPMKFVVQKEGRVPDPVILEIDPAVMTWERTQFSNVNAAAGYAEVGGGLQDLKKIRFDIILNGTWRDETEKHLFQAEVLVCNFIPLKYITNIHNI